MAGRFVTSNYQKNDDTNAPIRVQAETLTTWNVAATGSRIGGFVKARGSAKEYGTIARYVTLSRTVGDGTDYNSAVVLARVPIMTKEAWLALTDGTVVAYQGKADWRVAGQRDESIR